MAAGSRARNLVLAALLAGAALNLAAGARRPFRERALVHQGYYAEAQQAAAQVDRSLPPGTPLNLVVYENDYVGAMDGSVWAETYLKWLLYPRIVAMFRAAPDGSLRTPDGRPPLGYTLFFRVTAPPNATTSGLRILGRGNNWTLAESAEGAAG